VELVNRLHVRGIASEALVCYDVLAGVVALGRAIPEEEPAVEGCMVVSLSL
jgi:nitrogenase subunit NifH